MKESNQDCTGALGLNRCTSRVDLDCDGESGRSSGFGKEEKSSSSGACLGSGACCFPMETLGLYWCVLCGCIQIHEAE